MIPFTPHPQAPWNDWFSDGFWNNWYGEGTKY